MNLSLGTSLCAVLTTTLSLAILGVQDKPMRDTAPKQGGDMAQKMKEFGTPGADHKVLDNLVGKWSVDVKMYEPGSTTPMTSKGTSEIKWALDGRFIQETVQGDWMGQPFNGTALCGFDNLKKKYVCSWADNMSTGIMYREGTYDAGTKTFTFTGECPDVMAGKYSRSRSVEKMVDADHWKMETFKTGPDGKEVLAGQLDYQRVSK